MKFAWLKFTLVLFFLISVFAPSSILAAEPNLSFESTANSVKKYDTFDLSVAVDTDGIDSLGAGAKIFFNTSLLTVLDVQTTDIYDDYPSKFFDNEEGLITISGIVNSPKKPFTGKGILANITFQAIKEGNAKVWFNFEPGSTTDSNIAVSSGTGDVLSKVSNFEMYIYPNPEAGNDDTLLITPASEGSGGNPNLSNNPEAIENIDPEGPIPSLNPKTDSNTVQPTTSLSYVSTKPAGQFDIKKLLPIIGIAVLAIGFLFAVLMIVRKKKNQQPNQPVVLEEPEPQSPPTNQI